MTIQAVRARAPVRIDLAGGWTDVAEFCQDVAGYVVNLAIERYVHAEVLPAPGGVELVSEDFGIRLMPVAIEALRYDGQLDLLKAAVRRCPPASGILLRTWSDVPPASGLGTSAALAVALLRALSACRGEQPTSRELAELASSLEKEELGIRGGKQDPYASAGGGIQFLTFRGEQVSSERLELAPEILERLRNDLVLAHSGASHVSGDMHEKVYARFRAGDPQVLRALANLKKTAIRLRDDLLAGRLEEVGRGLLATWEDQKRLDPGVSTPRLDRLFEIARSAGAIGGKACGAGAGGAIAVLCRPGRSNAVREALSATDCQLFDWSLCRTGVSLVDS